MSSAKPALSVVLTAMGSLRSQEHTIARLLDQTIREQIELLLVAPEQEEPSWTPELRRRFHSVRLIALDRFTSIGNSNARGVREANADVVAFGEDHCFPEPGWAEALVAAHRAGWDAVGPQVVNANPNNGVSWADFLIGYAPWAAPQQSGQVSLLPGHNSSYKRDLLLEYGDSLAERLQAETVLHYDLRSKGRTLYLEAGARTAHVNFSKATTWFDVQVMQGRVFAAERRKDWAAPKRLFYAAASPLIPLVRLAKITREYFSAPRPASVYFKTLPQLAWGLSLDGVGQCLGYAFGVGDAMERIATLELQRFEHITASDKAALFPPDPLRAKLGAAVQ